MKNITEHFECPFGGHTTFIIEHFPSNKYIISQIILCIVNILLVIPTVILNSISVLTIFRNSQLKTKPCYFQILIQSLTDLGVGVIALPLYTYVRLSELLGTADCVSTIVSETTAYMVFGLSLTTLCMLTLERYVSVIHPIAHRSHLTARRLLVYNGCAAVPVITLPVFTLALPSEETYGFLTTSAVLMILLLHTFAYTRIFLAVKHRNFASDRIGDQSMEQNSSNFKKKLAMASLREQKLAKSCALVVVINYLCYIPSVLSYQYFVNDLVNFRLSHSWSITIYAMNSSLNSLIFFWKRPLLREEALKVLRCIFTR